MLRNLLCASSLICASNRRCLSHNVAHGTDPSFQEVFLKRTLETRSGPQCSPQPCVTRGVAWRDLSRDCVLATCSGYLPKCLVQCGHTACFHAGPPCQWAPAVSLGGWLFQCVRPQKPPPFFGGPPIIPKLWSLGTVWEAVSIRIF